MSEPRRTRVKTTAKRSRTMDVGGSSSAQGSINAARMDPYYSPNLQASRLEKFRGRKQTCIHYAKMSWLIEQSFEFPNSLEVKVANTFFENEWEGLYLSMVRGKLVALDEYDGSPLGDCENELWNSFDPVEMYKSCLHGP
ncbi:hypothetical protein Lal_00014529 [Lupinus albus]|nr:hypothetical protein Lal_00014529 [Lupinus albus]